MKRCLIGMVAAALLASPVMALPAAGVAEAAPKARVAAESKSRLQVRIEGVDRGSVRVSGRGTVRKVQTTRTLVLRPGTYQVRAKQVRSGENTYSPADATIVVRTRGGRTSVVSVFYAQVEKRSRAGVLPSPAPTGVLGEVFALVNQARARGAKCGASNLPPAPAVDYDDQLARAAQGHAQDMADNDFFDHVSLDGRTFVDRIEATGYKGDPGGENIASGFQSAQEVVQAWLDSPGHCANMMDRDFGDIGLGLASRSDARYAQPVTYWVQNFGYKRR